MAELIKSLEGWLLKKKSQKKLFSSSDVKRWFKVEIVSGEDNEELALCYYQNKQSKDSKGWIFLSDITEINEDAGIFTIVSPHRTMALEAQTRAEHRHWITGLTTLCPHALINGVAQQKESLSPVTVGSKGSDSKNRPGSGSRPNSSDSAAAIDGSGRLGPGKSGRHHNFDEDKSEVSLRRSNDSYRENDREYDEDRRGRINDRERGSRDRERDRDRGDDSDRGRDSSTERGTRYREDHRLRNDKNDLSSHEATASARMHGHISRGDGNEERYNERPRVPDRPPSRPTSKESDQTNTKGLRNSREGRDFDQNDDLEALDINKPAQPSREALLQDRKERLRSSSQEISRAPSQENKTEESEENNNNIKQDKKIKAPSGPRPVPRRAADLHDDESEDGDSDGNASDCNRREYSRPLASAEIDDLRPGSLMVNLDDSDDDGGEMDFKAEKRRYGSDDKSSANDGPGSRPPRPPNKPQAKHESSNNTQSSSNSRQSNGSGNGKVPSKDSNFVTDDWDNDDDDEPVPSRRSRSKSTDKQQQQQQRGGASGGGGGGSAPVPTGPKADSNWLNEDFDD